MMVKWTTFRKCE